VRTIPDEAIASLKEILSRADQAAKAEGRREAFEEAAEWCDNRSKVVEAPQNYSFAVVMDEMRYLRLNFLSRAEKGK
jgi:hypothetical protein